MHFPVVCVFACASLLATAPAGAVRYVWSTGQFIAGTTAPSPLQANDVLDIQIGGVKTFATAFENRGRVNWTDDNLSFVRGANVFNARGGIWDAQSDNRFDGAAALDAVPTFVNGGTFRKSGGTGRTVIGNVVFINQSTGVLDAQTGTIEYASTVGQTFQSGTVFKGAGQHLVTGRSTFVGNQDIQGNVRLGTGVQAFDARGRLFGDGVVIKGVLEVYSSQPLEGVAGQQGVAWTVAAQSTLKMHQDSGGIRDATVEIREGGTLELRSTNLALNRDARVVNFGLLDVGSDGRVGGIGAQAGTGTGTLLNRGTFAKTDGRDRTVINLGEFVNSFDAVLDARTATIEYSSTLQTFLGGTVFKGAGLHRIIGQLDATLPRKDSYFYGEQVIEGNVQLLGAQAYGQEVIIRGALDVTTSSLNSFNAQGTNWTVASSSRLRADRSGLYTSMRNDGLIEVRSSFSMSAASELRNTGRIELRDGAQLGSEGMIANVGVIGRTGNASPASIQGLRFTNEPGGILETQLGQLRYEATTLNHFAAGTQFKGSGEHVVRGPAEFAGAQQVSGNLTLNSPAAKGSEAVISGRLNWAGSARLQGQDDTSELTGAWTIGRGSRLFIKDGGDKNLKTSQFVNEGTVTWEGSKLRFGSSREGTEMVNNGVFLARSDHPMQGSDDAFRTPAIFNNGIFRKVGGSGDTAISKMFLINRREGLVDVQTGTLSFDAGFVQYGTMLVAKDARLQVNDGLLRNDGTLKGEGLFRTHVWNLGHVAPGNTVGVLNVEGQFDQGAEAFLDLDVSSRLIHDRLSVIGSVNLGGTLAVTCVLDCQMSVGDELVALNYTGTRTGTFASLTLSGFATGRFNLVYDDANTRVLLRATEAVSAVPELPPAAMMLAGMALVAATRRRRHA